MAHALRRNGRTGARSANGDGGALCARCDGERAREGERGGATGSGGEGGRTWWSARVRPPRRMRATRLPSSTGSPRRHGAAVRRVDVGAGAGRGRHAACAPLSLFHFF